MSAVVTGLGFAVPGVETPADLLGPVDETAAPIDFRARLGRKGLRYKDQATLLSRCAARDALIDAGLLDGTELRVPGDRVGVVVSSNFGNLDTICRTVETIATDSARVVSPMDLPNASSNVVASTIAISHGLRGPNLMLCNGITSGLDAVGWAVRLLAADRVDQVVVVGVEPDTEPARRLLGRDRAFDGAVALLVEKENGARDRGAPMRARLTGYTRRADLAACLPADADDAGGHVPSGPVIVAPPGAGSGPGAAALDPWLHTSGALGVLATVAAVGFLETGVPGPLRVVVGAERADAAAGLTVAAPPAPGETPAEAVRVPAEVR